MGFLQKLKSMLGFGRSREPSRGGRRTRGRKSDVTVERQPSTETEEAVKRSQASAGQATAGQQPQGTSQSPAETQPEGQSQTPAQPQAAAEESEAESASEGDDAEPSSSGTAAGEETAVGTDEDVTVLTGIGPAYGDRLEGAGIETVADLATADPADVAAETDLSEKRISGWIEQAEDR